VNTEIVGVIGAGVIGGGVAQNLAQTGHEVVVVDLTEEILRRAESRIRRDVRLQRMLKKDQEGVDADGVLGRIRFTTEYALLREVDFVIENVVEKWEVKEQVYTRIDRLCRRDCVFASNTSAIAITRIASVTNRAPQVIGIHFMNPVPLKHTVEVIRGPQTSSETIERTRTLLERMNKQVILVNDSPGFVSNRVLMLTINEAILVVQEQVAGVEDVDLLFKACFGHAMGPLETADLIGLDTILLTLETLCESYGEEKFGPAPLLREMVASGRLGQKSGEGFYPH
jgi:3-hydroxybutyryl-CoA dehydrogenase